MDQDMPVPDIDLKNNELPTDGVLKRVLNEPHMMANSLKNLHENSSQVFNDKQKQLESIACRPSSSYLRAGAPTASCSTRYSTPLVRNFDNILRRTQDGSIISPTVVKRKPVKKNVFTKIDQLDVNAGPLYFLKKHMNTKVKVLIRRRKKIPYISRVIEYKGTLSVFDKHMNIILNDSIESFKYKNDEKIYKRARHRDTIFIRGDNIIMICKPKANN